MKDTNNGREDKWSKAKPALMFLFSAIFAGVLVFSFVSFMNNQRKISTAVNTINSQGFVTAQSPVAPTTKEYRYITATGSASYESTDSALVTARISSTALNATTASENVDKTLESLIGKLFTLGIKDSAVKVSPFVLSGSGDETAPSLGYVDITITVPVYDSNKSKAYSVFDLLTEIENIDSVNLVWSVNADSDAEAELIKKAMKDAKNKAYSVLTSMDQYNNLEVADVNVDLFSSSSTLSAAVNVKYKIVE